ncbi:MAG: methylmalonyl-CoA epimerase [Bacteroidetes bacterium]|nr:methylmalonyl-CoA epimerase [Bacteroidota bacterium]MDA1120162.1 methylmalonyl-CoA epimerase [Bacteroidota bacterium]
MNKIEHIGIAVSNLKDANQRYFRLFGVKPYKTEEVLSENVTTSFFRLGESKIELLEGIGENNAITKFIKSKGEGIHHIAYDVDDIASEMKRLKNEGFEIQSDAPKIGADNKLVCFIHPKSAGGVLIELCQEINN